MNEVSLLYNNELLNLLTICMRRINLSFLYNCYYPSLWLNNGSDKD